MLFSLFANAAPAMKSNVCEITALVEAIEVREEKRFVPLINKHKTYKFTDVTLNIASATMLEEHMMGECSPNALPKVFQLRSDHFFSKEPKTGQCLKAKTQFSGDEVVIGQWLYDIEYVAEGNCSAVNQPEKTN